VLRRALQDLLRLYRRSWWRIGVVVGLVGLLMALGLVAISHLTSLVASHSRGFLLNDGRIRVSAANVFATGTAVVVAAICIPIVLVGVVAVVRITDDTLAGAEPTVWRSLSYGLRRMPRLVLGGLEALAIFLALVVLAPVLSAAGLLGLLLTWPVHLIGRRWPVLPQRWPTVRQLIVTAVPLGLAFWWLTRTIFVVPATSLEAGTTYGSPRHLPAASPRASRRAVAGLILSLVVVLVGESLVAWLAFLVASTRGRLLGQEVGQFLLLALPIVVLTILYRLGSVAGPDGFGASPTAPYGAGTPPLPAPFLANAITDSSPWRLRHRRLAFSLPIVLIAALVGVVSPAAADEGGGTTAPGSITLTVNSNADDTDPATLATEAANCAAASGPCTLRAAIAEAVALSGGGVDGTITVHFASSMTIDVSSVGSIAFLNSSDFSDDGQLNIDGSGHDIVLDGGGTNQVLELFSNTWNFAVTGIEVANAAATASDNQDGGGLFIAGSGTSTVDDDTFTNDLAANAGGAIFASGPLLVENSTFGGNTAQPNNNPNDYPSGGADIYSVGAVTVDSDSFFQSNGGSLFDLASAFDTIAVNNSLFVETSSGGFDCTESAEGGFSGVDNVTATGVSSGDTTCPGSIVAPAGSPTVSALQSVKAGTPPVLPLAPSQPGGQVNAALGAAGNDGVPCPVNDERGQARPSTACDAGSYEYNSATQITVSSSENPSVFGDQVDLTALVTLSAGVGVPKGTVQFSVDGSSAGNPVTVDANGDAVLTTSTLTAGTHSVTAAFTSALSSAYGDSATTTPLVQTVDASGSTVTLSSSENPAAVGDSVIYSIAVSGSTNIPTGTVSLSDTSTNPATVVASGVALDGSGKASVTSNALPAGQHDLVARYSGDTNDAPGMSATLDQDIRAASTVTISASTSSTTFGVPDTLTVSVPASAGGVVATGTVQIASPSSTMTQFADVTLSGGSGALTLSDLPAGTADKLTATYLGDTTYAPSAPSSTTVDEAAASSATALTLTPSGPVAYGVPVQLSATVSDTTSGSAVDPDGSVDFATNDGDLGTVALVGNGNGTSTATLTTTAGQLPESAGLDVTVSYSGSNDFGVSVSTTKTLVVTQASTTLSLTSSVNPSVFGQSVLLTATPSATGGSLAVPTGTVTFSDGTTVLGMVAVSAGTAALSVSTLAVASHQITAAFVGSGPFGDSGTTSALSQVVNQSSTATSLTVTPGGPSRFGTTLHLAISVMATDGGSGAPDGTVTVTDNGNTIDTVTLSGGSGSVAIPSAFATSHTFVATYSGSTDFLGSNDSAVYSITSAATTSSLGVSPFSSTFGDQVSITDTVTNTSTAVAPTGAVSFSTSGEALGTVPLVPTGATTSTAVLTTTSLPESAFDPGQQLVITANYDGDPNFAGGTATENYTVAQGTTSVSLGANHSTVGVPTTLTATIGVVTGAGTPSGSVLFTDSESAGGARNLGTATVSNGQAVLTGILFPLGTDTVTATYTSGDANFVAGAPAVLPLVVGQGSLTIAGTVSASGLTYGAPDSLTATLSGASTLAPTGSVTFTAIGPGVDVVLGSAALSANAPYEAVLNPSTAPIPVGAQTISAAYSGDANYSGISTSITAPVIVPAATAVALVASPNPSFINQAVIFTATLTDPSTGATPQGSVAFSLGNVELGSVAVNNLGQAALATTPGTAGSPTVTATFTPNADFTGSVGMLAQQINVLPTTVTLSASQQALSEGQSTTFTAVVEPTNVVASFARSAPTGEVVVSDGQGHGCTISLGPDAGNSLDSFGTCQASWPNGGQFTAVGSYPGDASFAAAASRGVGILVGQQVPQLSLTSSPTTWVAGDPVTLSWSVVGPTANDSTVTINDNGQTICSSAQLVGSCVYTFARGSALVTLAYAGDASWQAGTTTLSQAVPGCIPFTAPTVSPAGAGSITVVTTSNCGGGYIEGTRIVLEETAASGYQFQEWADTGSPLAVESVTAVYPGPTSDEAIFDPICAAVTLAVSDPDSAGGSITSSQAPNCGPVPRNWQETSAGMVGSFAEGTVLTLTPVAPGPLANGATQVFYDWSGDVPVAEQNTPTLTVTVSGDLDFDAHFGVTCFHGITFPAPAGATASISATNCTDPTGAGYAQDSTITVSTMALGTQYFTGWSSGVAITTPESNGSVGSYEVTRGGVTIAAFYASCLSFGVAATGSGPDGGALGTVTVSPAGTCPTLGAGWYTRGSTVDITATANGFADGIFDGWTGPPTKDGGQFASNQVVVTSGGNTETAVFYYGAGCQPFSTEVIPAGSATVTTQFGAGPFACPAGSYDDLASSDFGTPISVTTTPTHGNPLVGWTGTTAEVDRSAASASNPNGPEVPVTVSGQVGPTFSATVLGPTSMQAWACEEIDPTVTLISPNGTSHTGPPSSGVTFIGVFPSPNCPLGTTDYVEGSRVHPEADAPIAGYTLQGWSGSTTGSELDPPAITIDGSSPTASLNVTYKVNCFTLTTGTSGLDSSDQYTLGVAPAPNCPDEPASANMYIGGTVVTMQETEPSDYHFLGWSGTQQTAASNDGSGYAYVIMNADASVTADYEKLSFADKLVGDISTATNDVAIAAKKAVGVVAAVVGGVAIGLNPLTGPVGVLDEIGLGVVDLLQYAGVSGSGLDAVNSGLEDVSQTLSFAISDLTCATEWSANANTGGTGAAQNTLGQVGAVASASYQAVDATETYDQDVNDYNADYAENGDAAVTEELSTTDHVIGLVGKYGSRLGVAAAVGTGIYQEVEGGPNVGWDSSASSAWTGGGDVYSACISASEPSYITNPS
jgi:hypothetical protein